MKEYRNRKGQLTIETAWGTHEVISGRRRYAGKWIARSGGWGGARGYFKIFATEAEAEEFIREQVKPLPKSDAIKL